MPVQSRVDQPIETIDLISEFSENPHSYFPHILQKNDLTVTERTEALTRIRSMADNLQDPAEKENFLRENTFALLVGQKGHAGDFQKAIETMEAANLSIEDLEPIWNPAINDLDAYIIEAQTGDWILWLQDTIPAEKSEQRVRQLLERWQTRDPEAATAFAKKHDLGE